MLSIGKHWFITVGLIEALMLGLVAVLIEMESGLNQ